MSTSGTIKINFRGGIVSPGDLYNILVAATRARIRYVSFGLRQQLIMKVPADTCDSFCTELKKLNFFYECDLDNFPNIISSYPAEEVFITNTWLSEGVYKDIFDGFEHEPALKINISDSNQSFTPMLTGNINWVASASASHFWHLFIRFPKTNNIYEWDQLVYTNDIPRLSQKIESVILANASIFCDNQMANGELLFSLLNTENYITRHAEQKAVLPPFNLPYYEGLNKYNTKYWLGVYRRDELFGVDYLKELCLLCLDTKIGQLCSTPWKSIIIKGIEEKDRARWNQLLEKYQLNMRHAANELNFQVEDNCEEGLALKNYLVKKLNDDDVRTFGICIGIKTRRKSEVFSSILVRKKSLFRLLGTDFFSVYDILCAKGFNPNERTEFIFSKNNPKFLLAEQLRRTIVSFYHHRSTLQTAVNTGPPTKKIVIAKTEEEFVHQCPNCLSVYDPKSGDPENEILPGTSFENLPVSYCCSLCETPISLYNKVPMSQLGLQPI